MDMARFPMRQGSTAHPAPHDQSPPTPIRKFEVEEGKEYPVKLWATTASGDDVGSCTVGGTEGAFWVEPEANVTFPAEDCTFYASWDVDPDGIAHLNEVQLVVKT